MFSYHCSIVSKNFKVISFVNSKLWLVKVIKSDVREWRVFAEPVTYYMHSFVTYLLLLVIFNLCLKTIGIIGNGV